MHKWYFLLLALVAAFQPIASFTERNIVDGREQCCDRSGLLRDTRLSYGTLRHHKLPENRLNERVVIRDTRRNEVRDNSPFDRISTQRRLVELRSEREGRRLTAPVSSRVALAARERFTEFNVLPSTNERRSEFRGVRDERRREAPGSRYSRDTGMRLQERDTRDISFRRQSEDRSSRLSRASSDERRHHEHNRNEPRDFSRAQSRERSDLLQRDRANVGSTETFRDRRSVDRVYERRFQSRVRDSDNRERRSHLERARTEFRDVTSRSNDDARKERLQLTRRDVRNQLNERDVSRRISDRRHENREVLMMRNRVQEKRNHVQNIYRERDSTVRLSRSQERVNPQANRVSETRRRESTRERERSVSRQQRNIDSRRRETRSAERFEARENKRDTTRVHFSMGAEDKREASVERRISDSRVRSHVPLSKLENSEMTYAMNWQYLFYALQGIYLSSLLIQILNKKDSGNKKAPMWWNSFRQAVKMD